RAHLTNRSLQTLTDVEERAPLLAVAPDLDAAALLGQGNLPAQRRRRLLPAVVPSALGPENIMIARYAHLHPVVPVECHVEPLTEQLLPAVVAVGRRRISRILFEAHIGGIALVVLRIDARRRRVEDPPRVAPVAG